MVKGNRIGILNRLSLRFRRISWRDRILVSLAVIVVLGVGAWRLNADPITTAAVVAGGAVLINIIMLLIPWISVGIAWLINLMTMPMAAGVYGIAANYDIGAIDIGTLTFGLVSLFASSVLFTYLSYKYAPGRLWLNLLAIFLIQNLFSAFLLAYLAEIGSNIASIGVLFGIITAAIYLVVRIWVSKKRRSVFFEVINDDAMAKMQKRLEEGFSGTNKSRIFVNKNTDSPHILPNFAIVTPYSMSLVYARSGEQPLEVKKKGLTYDGMPFNDFAALILQSASHIAHKVKREQVNVILSGTRILPTGEPAQMNLLMREGRNLGTLYIMNAIGLPNLIKKLPVGTQLTKEQQENILELFSVKEIEAEVKKENSDD